MFFFVRSRLNPQLALELEDQSPEPETPVIAARRVTVENHITQHWEICLGELQPEEPLFYLRNRLHGFAAEREGGDGSGLAVFAAPQDCVDGDLQLWELVPARDGAFFVRSKIGEEGGRDMVLELAGGGRRAGTAVVASPRMVTGNDHQLWDLLPVCLDAR